MRKLLLALFILFAYTLTLQAQYSDEDIFVPKDTIVNLNNFKVRIRTLDYSSFKRLEDKYTNTDKSSIKITNLKEVTDLLGPSYKIVYTTTEYFYQDEIVYSYFLDYVERRGVYRHLLRESSDGFQAYYPEEKIFLYFGGHSSDQAFFIETGEPAFNPIYSATQKDGKFRLVGKHTGQESIEGNIQRKDKKTGEFITLFTINELKDTFGYKVWDFDFWKSQFWHKNTLYISMGYGNYGNKEGKEWDGNNTFMSISLVD